MYGFVTTLNRRVLAEAMRDDRQFNISFVRLVEKHPVLYDFRLPEYFRRDEQDKAWTSVAREVNEPTEECKSRWRVLRGSLTRHLKQRGGPKAKKPYYLYNVMQFVIPFTKTRKQNGQDSPPRDDETLLAIKSDNNTYNEPVFPAEDDEQSTSQWGDNRSTSSQELKKPTPKRAKIEQRAAEYFNAKSNEVKKKDDPHHTADLDFFRSVLPDIAHFSPKQKRQFKLGVIKLIDDIIAEDETCTVTGIPSIFPATVFT